MAVIRTDSFERSLEDLPSDVQQRAEEQITFLIADLRDPRLHVKKLRKPLDGVYSFRITRNYRALFYFNVENDVIVFDVDTDKPINLPSKIPLSCLVDAWQGLALPEA